MKKSKFTEAQIAKSVGRDDQVIRMRIREIAQTRVRYGSERIFTLLRWEGFKDSYNRVYTVMRGCNCKSPKNSNSLKSY